MFLFTQAQDDDDDEEVSEHFWNIFREMIDSCDVEKLGKILWNLNIDVGILNATAC